jgi:NAD-dependent deacetylase
VKANRAVALTGAGVSVESGIPDFRSAGGIWEKFHPQEYTTLQAFLSFPDKAWEFYRELGRTLEGKRPGPAHTSLAELERFGLLHGVITQNIDSLHTAAGSDQVIEVHGDSRNLQCLQCGRLEPVKSAHYRAESIPTCVKCDFALKPNVVLFGEGVRKMDEATALLRGCDLLLVIGTSAQVYPVSELPALVHSKGGKILEFNVSLTRLTPICEFSFRGPAGSLLPLLVESACD